MPFDRSDIARIAAANGIDPAYAMAVAERESSFNPNARNSRTIQGLFQMTGANRARYGVPDNADPETQVHGFSAFTRDLRNDMAQRLGRAPTPGEMYLGHFWGAGRAARAIKADHSGTDPADFFTPQEIAQNPGLQRGTVGSIAKGIIGDFSKRHARYNGGDREGTVAYGKGQQEYSAPDFAMYGVGADGDDKGSAPDFSVFGAAPQATASNDKRQKPQWPQPPAAQQPAAAQQQADATPQRPGQEIDLSLYGLPKQAQAQPQQPMPQQAQQPAQPQQDFTGFGAAA